MMRGINARVRRRRRFCHALLGYCLILFSPGVRHLARLFADITPHADYYLVHHGMQQSSIVFLSYSDDIKFTDDHYDF